MNFNDIPLLSMLKGRLGYLNQRQSIIAQNVANSDTPGFVPRDLTPFQTAKTSASAGLPMAPITPTTTGAAQISLPSSSAPTATDQGWKAQNAPDSETRLDGNQVVLEEEMMKMNDSRMNYNAAINFYEQSMNLIQTAIRIPPK